MRRLLLVALLALSVTTSHAGELLRPGDKAPRFRFPDLLTEETLGFADVARDGPLMLVFLQTACRSCVREMVALKNVQAQVGNLGVLAVFLDLRPRGLEEYVAEYDLPFTFTWDGQYVTADAYGVSFSPTTFLLDRDGVIAAVYPGFTIATERHIRTDLDTLLAPR